MFFMCCARFHPVGGGGRVKVEVARIAPPHPRLAKKQKKNVQRKLVQSLAVLKGQREPDRKQNRIACVALPSLWLSFGVDIFLDDLHMLVTGVGVPNDRSAEEATPYKRYLGCGFCILVDTWLVQTAFAACLGHAIHLSLVYRAHGSLAFTPPPPQLRNNSRLPPTSAVCTRQDRHRPKTARQNRTHVTEFYPLVLRETSGNHSRVAVGCFLWLGGYIYRKCAKRKSIKGRLLGGVHVRVLPS